MSEIVPCLTPNWAAPARVRASFSTRRGGVSSGPWTGLNLAAHVGDDPAAVAHNRARLRAALALPAEPCWLEQVHGTRVVRPAGATELPPADAGYTRRAGVVCAVMVADCVPILLCSRRGDEVAAVHAGWRGLAAGIVARATAAFAARAHDLMAWIGPAIGPSAYVVGSELRAQFLAADPGSAALFKAQAAAWLLDLPGLAARQLARAGVHDVSCAGRCVHSEPTSFYSYRRDGITGRMAALIWLAPA